MRFVVVAEPWNTTGGAAGRVYVEEVIGGKRLLGFDSTAPIMAAEVLTAIFDAIEAEAAEAALDSAAYAAAYTEAEISLDNYADL